MRLGKLQKFGWLGEEGQRHMRAAMIPLNLSARAYHRILKLARTIPDLAGSEEVHSVHLAEALHTSQPAEIDAEEGFIDFPHSPEFPLLPLGTV